MQTTQTTPLCMSLYVQYEANIAKARGSLFHYLQRRYSSEVAEMAKSYLENRIEKSRTPLSGEMFPWMLRSIFPLRGKDAETKFNTLLIEWLCVYLLVTMIDDEMDEGTKAKGVILMPLILESKDYIAATDAHVGVMAQIKGAIFKTPNHEKNIFLRTFVKKINAISAYPNEELVDVLGGSPMMKFSQYCDDIADVDDDLHRMRVSSMIKPYMIETKNKMFIGLLIESKPTDILSDVAESLNKLADVSRIIAGAVHKQQKAINNDLAAYTAISPEPATYSLDAETSFFSSLSDGAKGLAQFIISKRFSTHGENDGKFAREAKARMDVLAQST